MRPAIRTLLAVTGDGYGKRVPVSEIPMGRRDRKGVRLSSVPLAAVVLVNGGDIVIATALGKI